MWGVGNLQQRVQIEGCFCTRGQPFLRTAAVEVEPGGAGNKPAASSVTESTEHERTSGQYPGTECVKGGHEEGETGNTGGLGLCPGWEVRNGRDLGGQGWHLGMWQSEFSGFVRAWDPPRCSWSLVTHFWRKQFLLCPSHLSSD